MTSRIRVRSWVNGLLWAGFLAWVSAACAEDRIILHLKSGDQISGVVQRETGNTVFLRSDAVGTVKIPKGSIVRRTSPQELQAEEKAARAAAQAAQEERTAAEKRLAQLEKELAQTKAAQSSGKPATDTDATTQAKAVPSGEPVPQVDPAAAAPTAPVARSAPATAVTPTVPAPAPVEPVVDPSSKNVRWYLPSTYVGALIKPLFTNWSGSIGVGTDFGFGTRDRTSFNANLKALHTWNRVRNDVVYNATYGTVNKVRAANRMEGSVKTDVDLYQKRRLYGWNQFFMGYDEARRIEHRFEEGFGLGYKVFQNPRLVVNVEAGIQYQHFDFSLTPSRDIWSGRLSQNLTWKPNTKLTLAQSVSMLQNIQDYDEFRVRLTVNATYPLYKKISFKLDIINEYETNPHRGVEGNDLQVQASLGLRFP
jgi:hypothetical protein